MNHQATILASRFYPDVQGGVEMHMTEFARELARQGVAVRVLTEMRKDLPRHERLSQNLHVFREDPLDLGCMRRWPCVMQVRWWIHLLKKQPPAGLVWASNAASACAAILLGYREQLVYNPARCSRAMAQMGRLYSHLTTMQLSKAVQRMDSFAYKRAKCVVVSSLNLKDQYTQFEGPRDNIFVQPLAASTPLRMPLATVIRKQWAIDNQAFVVGFVGELVPCKGLDFLFDAFQFAPRRSDTKLLIVGDGPDKQRLQTRAKRMGLESRIIWAGAMKDPAAAYAAMDVLVLPSIYEAFGMVLLEAMAAGVPVLSRRGNGRTIMTASEQIIDHGHNGFLLDPHYPNDMARQIREMETNLIKRHAMGTAARFTARQYTWRRYTERCLHMLFGLAPVKKSRQVLPYSAAA